ncbi:MAG: glycosyltransferase involved in cell wall biosynthesis [Crocinitomix sp.]|jgi:glycosyltransferase involved in cell wall biosynthesis
MPFFSIIIPTYNRAHLIGTSISSALAQTYTNFEVIIVDDGSTDDTKVVLEKFKDDRIRTIYQENGERGKARNNGVKNALGEYVFFLDSDDLIYPNHLQIAFDAIRKLEAPAFFHSRYEEIHGTIKKQVPPLFPNTLHANIIRQNKFACQFYLKRSVALEIPFSENRELKIGEDWEVILKVAMRYKLNFSNEVTAAIVHHGERSMEVASTEVIIQSRDILLANLRNDSEIDHFILWHVWAELTTLAGLSAAINNEKRTALKYLFRGIKKRPNHLFKRRTLAIFKKIIFNAKA